MNHLKSHYLTKPRPLLVWRAILKFSKSLPFRIASSKFILSCNSTYCGQFNWAMFSFLIAFSHGRKVRHQSACDRGSLREGMSRGCWTHSDGRDGEEGGKKTVHVTARLDTGLQILQLFCRHLPLYPLHGQTFIGVTWSWGGHACLYLL